MLSLRSHLPRFCIIDSRCSAYDVPERTERDLEQKRPLPFCATYSVLNRNTGDWHRGALADRSMVARPIAQSSRSCCAERDDSKYSSGCASPHVGRIAPGPLWVLVGPAPVVAVCRGPHPQRDCRRALLFAFERLSGGEGVPGGHAHV